MINTRRILSGLLLCSVILVQGCLLEVTSVTVPGSAATGQVITLTVTGTGTGSSSGGQYGIVLQIPEGTQVLRASRGNIILDENVNITAAYTPEPGYRLYGATGYDTGGFPFPGSGTSSISVKVWLAITDSTLPGGYVMKAAVGQVSSGWVPQNPQINGAPMVDFSQITGAYASNLLTISTGLPDLIPPASVTPSFGSPFTIDISSYDEASQGDVAKYRIYLSKSSFTDISGAMFLDETTRLSVTGTQHNEPRFSSDFNAGLYFFEVPPGSEFPIIVNGLSMDPYFVAVTAVDLSGNESAPAATPLNRGTISGRVTDGTVGLGRVSINVTDDNCNYVSWQVTDVDGNYMIQGLAAGTYRLFYEDQMGEFLSGWYNDKTDCTSADAVTVTAGLTTAVGDVVLRPGGILEGTVTNGSKGIAGIVVYLLDSNCGIRGSAHSDGDGRYTFKGLPSGDYHLGFYDDQDLYFDKWYGDAATCADSAAVPVSEGDTTIAMDTVMTFAGSISGRVTDNEEVGLNWLLVYLYGDDCVYLGFAYTDSNGYYIFHGLLTGNYRINFNPSGGTFVNEWYADKASCAVSDPVHVTTGVATSAIDASLALAPPAAVSLWVNQSGAGSGRVTSSPAGIDCGRDCGESFAWGAAVDLTAVPDVNSYFAGWSGDCAGNSTCRLYMEGPRNVSAIFDPLVDFVGTPTSGPIPLVVSFTDTSRNQPSSWMWEFGDGSTSTLQNPQHVYYPSFSSASYSVKLTATGPDGTQSVTKSNYIYAYACSTEHVRVGDIIFDYYTLIQNAYNVAGAGEYVEAQAGHLNESLYFDHNVAVTLRGGYNCDYSSLIDYTVINGSLTITDGTVNVEYIVLK